MLREVWSLHRTITLQRLIARRLMGNEKRPIKAIGGLPFELARHVFIGWEGQFLVEKGNRRLVRRRRLDGPAMSWGKLTILGVEYDLTHLDATVIVMWRAFKDGSTYRVLVSYGCHCFARELRASDHADFHIADNGDTRCVY